MARTSASSATVVIARWSDDVVVVLEADKGFVEPTRFFDWLFGYVDKYGVLLRTTYVEAQGSAHDATSWTYIFQQGLEIIADHWGLGR